MPRFEVQVTEVISRRYREEEVGSFIAEARNKEELLEYLKSDEGDEIPETEYY